MTPQESIPPQGGVGVYNSRLSSGSAASTSQPSLVEAELLSSKWPPKGKKPPSAAAIAQKKYMEKRKVRLLKPQQLPSLVVLIGVTMKIGFCMDSDNSRDW